MSRSESGPLQVVVVVILCLVFLVGMLGYLAVVERDTPKYVYNTSEMGVSYIVFQEGSDILVKNGGTSLIEYQSPNATLAIQYAIDHAGSGIVHIARGTYTVAGNNPYGSHTGLALLTALQVSSNVTITGEGQGTIIKMNKGVGNVISGSACQNVTISNLVIDGDNSERTLDWWFRSNGIYFHYGSSNICIKDVSVINTLWMGIAFTGARNSSIINCEVIDNANMAGYGLVYTWDVSILNSRSFNNGHDYYLASTNNTRIDGCTSAGVGHTHRCIFPEYINAGLVFTNNIVNINDGIWGVALSDFTDSVVSNNIITGNSPDNGAIELVRCDRVIISNNLIQATRGEPAAHGIRVYYDSRNITITSNVFNNVTNAISVSSLRGNIQIESNIINYGGIYVSEGNKTVIRGNVINHAPAIGVQFIGYYIPGWIQDISIIDNTINNATSYGLKISEVNHAIIFGNKITETYTGMHLAYLYNASIESNILLYCGTPMSFFYDDNLTVNSNQGFITENHGVATISAGTSSVIVHHGLSVTADCIYVTGSTNSTATLYAYNLDVNRFAIVASGTVASDVTVYWWAEVDDAGL